MRAHNTRRGHSSRRNERLATALKEASLRQSDVAAAVGVNLKSVQRWVGEGRVPRERQVAVRVGQLLGADPAWLWPKLAPRLQTPDLVRLYDQIGDVPRTLWMSLARSAQGFIVIASDTTPFFPVDGLADLLESRAADGVQVRLCLGGSLRLMRIPHVEIRNSPYPEMISIFRFDETMLVWLNRGGPGLDRLGPVLRLIRAEDNGLFDAYAFTLRSLWTQASVSLHMRRPS